MNKQFKNQEKGSVLIEVIAVVALLGVMGPLLFKQVSSRNEEVENINIASEIRIMKEAFSSYIMNYHADISCNEQNKCSPDTTAIQSYLPAGFETSMGGYNFEILKNATSQGSSTLQGFIIPDLADLGLEGLSLKRVARIATLIGADGGILRKSNDRINGTGGAWQMAKTSLTNAGITVNNTSDHLFIATTGIDTYIPTVKYEDFDQSNILMPDDGFVSKRLHAWNYFSVGQVNNSSDTARCYELNHNSLSTTSDGTTTASSDIIYNANENSCDPLFWVSADGGDDSGNVFVKNQLHFRSSPDPSKSPSIVIASEPLSTTDKRPASVLIEGTGTTSATPTVDENKKRRIVVYTSNGKEAIVINGQGEIIARGSDTLNNSEAMSGKTGESETLTIKNGRMETNVKATKSSTEAGSAQAYKVDPRHISVMGDIRLESRGGAKLSDLLPKYQLKEVITISTKDDKFSATVPGTIPMPSCLNEHVPAIVITPVQWHQTTEQEITDTVSKYLVAQDNGLLTPVADKIPSTYPILPRVSITYDSAANKEYHHQATEKPVNDNWKVSLYYTQQDTAITDIIEPITALVHTYCVYVGTSAVTERTADGVVN